MHGMTEVFAHALMITGFVFVMMLVVEYLNVLTRGQWDQRIGRLRWGQHLIAAACGASPGCFGAYVVASLYMHRVMTFGALLAAMLATAGDETFVMMVLFPGRTALLLAVLAAAGILSGIVADAVLNRRRTAPSPHLSEYEAAHPHEVRCVPFSRRELVGQWRNCSPQRGWLTVFLALFTIGVLTGAISHHHFPGAVGEIAPAGDSTHAAQPHLPAEGAERGDDLGHTWDWARAMLLFAGLIGLLIVATVPDHFLDEHLWRHLFRVHIGHVFLWTLGALAATHLLLERFDVASHLAANRLPTLLVACAVGLIPQSGPHLIFTTLYAQGALPFSVLLANSIIQDGHGMLPILAHSRRAFAGVKVIKLVLGLVVGLVGHAMGW